MGEQVILHVEVATDQWFVKGAKIADFSLPNALVLNHQANNINSVVRKHGRRYASQIVEIPLYPQTEGRFVIPSLAVEFTVKHGNESVSGMLETTPVAFDVRLPSPEFCRQMRGWLGNASLCLKQLDVFRLTLTMGIPFVSAM